MIKNNKLYCDCCNTEINRTIGKREKEYKHHFCCKQCEAKFRKGKLNRPKMVNEIALQENYAIIKIKNNLYGDFDCLIDIEDIEKVKKFYWNVRYDKRHPNCTPYVESRKKIDGKSIRIHLHRFIMNCPNDMVIDHINGNNLDNRKENLKICTQQKNTLNNHFAKNISYINRDKKYVVSFQVNGKQKVICYTRDIKEAEYYANLGRNLIKKNKLDELLLMPCKFLTNDKKEFDNKQHNSSL